MERHYFCSSLTITSLWLVLAFLGCLAPCATTTGGCSLSLCFSHDYEACSPEVSVRINASSRARTPVRVVLRTLDPSQPGWPGSLFQSMLTLLCDQLGPAALTEEEPPYCWELQRTVVSTEPCDTNCTCTELEFVVYDVSSQTVLSSLRVTDTISTEQSRLVLRFLGFTIVALSTSEGSSLFSVPTLSWVFISLGLTVFVVILLAPLWWDKVIAKVCRKGCHCDKHKLDSTKSEPGVDSKELHVVEDKAHASHLESDV